jgi:hypothetical protein
MMDREAAGSSVEELLEGEAIAGQEDFRSP